MPITTAQLLQGANYQLESYATNDPVDQFTADRPFANWLIANKTESVFGNGIFNEKVRISNDSNYQNYTGDDQVSYNRKDTVRKAPFQHYEAHDGFTLNETELSDNGIILTDDRNAVMTDAEKIQIVDKLKEGWASLKDGFQENWDLEVHLDGSTNTKAVPGLDALVSTTPAVGTIGGIDASAATYWRNFANMGVATATPGTLIAAMEVLWRQTTTYGGRPPNAIFVGSSFYDAFMKDSLATMSREISIGQSSTGGVSVDPATKAMSFHGVPVIWDPSFDRLDDILGPITYPWKKRAYFLNSNTIKLRPVKGRWMIKRTPARVYDRYTHYFGLTADYGLTTNKRNSNAVMSIA